ncbi:MAG: D-alanyl-D-alanine carboxypeptidase [Clostridia bacterium]|nr:D-alanyl-D-alanine carboxypeptidase [Clostridia bacterium]
MRLKKSFFINILLVFILLFSMFSTYVEANETDSPAPVDTQATKEIIEKNLNLYAKSCILIERSTGRTAYEKNADEKVYPASTTKILTAIVVLEHCDLNDIVTITPEMITPIPVNYKTAALRPGEQVTVDELLHVLLIPSANDAGYALAIHISGSVDEFSKLMNEKARQIGCENSNFTNPSGIHNSNHYSTARDMAKIGICAMNYPHIMDIMCKTEYTLHENQFNSRHYTTTNTLITPNEKNYYEFANGMKTGFTNQAGSCIIATAKKDNMEFLAVVLGAPEPDANVTYRDVDCKTLFEYGFANYDEITKTDSPVLEFLKSIFSKELSITVIFNFALIILAILLVSVMLEVTRNKKEKVKPTKKKDKKQKNK